MMETIWSCTIPWCYDGISSGKSIQCKMYSNGQNYLTRVEGILGTVIQGKLPGFPAIYREPGFMRAMPTRILCLRRKNRLKA